jgi:hypothetical protein
MAGMVTDLPVHQSSEEEIQELVDTTKQLLVTLLKNFTQELPKIITVARSTDDEYTPANQVEFIQDSVTMAMKHVYHQSCDKTKTCVMIQYHYLTTVPKYSHKWKYESPADICDCTYL